MNKYLSELGIATCCDGFIPENIFYRLAMKAKNKVAEAFQAKVADEIIPQILMKGNVPYQSQIEQNHFILKESVVYKGGMPDVVKTTYVTGKGQRFIVNKLKKEISQTYVPA